jgi:hypothetical protein
VNWDDVVGKHILIGLTYVDEHGDVTRQEQKHGLIVRADDEGVIVQIAGRTRDEMWLPPAREAFEPAAEGEYRLRGTGEVVVDPDLIATWTIGPGS